MNNKRYTNTERLGINATERIVLNELNWIFREQPIADFGIDAMIEVVINGNPTRCLIAAQIKTGAGNFHVKEKELTHYITEIHRNYWLNGNTPAILIAHLPETESTYWVSLEERNFTKTDKRWKLDIAKKQKFGAMSERRLLELVNLAEPTEKPEWNEKYILALRKRIEGLFRATSILLDYTKINQSIRQNAERTTIIYTNLASAGLGIKSREAQVASKLFATQLMSAIPELEKCVEEFALTFSDAIAANKEFILGCLENDMDYVVHGTLNQYYDFRESVNYVLETTKNLKDTVNKFIKEDVEVKKATVIYSKVLSALIEEFIVARDMNERIITILEYSI